MLEIVYLAMVVVLLVFCVVQDWRIWRQFERVLKAMEESHREDMRTQAQVLLARSSGQVTNNEPQNDEEAQRLRRNRQLPTSMLV